MSKRMKEDNLFKITSNFKKNVNTGNQYCILALQVYLK